MFGVKFLALAAVVTGGLLSVPCAEAQPQSRSVPISATDKALVISAAVSAMNRHYVFEEVAKRVASTLVDKQKAGAYAAITDSAAFAARLTDDIQAVTRDRHIRATFSADAIPERKESDKPSVDELISEKREAARRNFGVERVERLPLNIGYIDLRGFVQAGWSGDSLAAAMTLIANTDALIIDLRRNGGGNPNTVALMTSYLLDERTHLNSFFYRDENKTEQFWTQDWVPGKRFGGSKPVYVLTSKRTFSAAEEFSYNLKALKRGTIVGEATGGGAHPGAFNRLTDHFMMFVPNGRAINPITKANWEGIGVEPDVKVPADDALRTAQLLALNKLSETEKDPMRADAFKGRMTELVKAATAN